MAETKEHPALKLKRDIQEIFLEKTSMTFSEEVNTTLAKVFTFSETVQYVVATIKRKNAKGVITLHGNEDYPTAWLVDLKEKQVKFLSLDLFDYDDPEIVKVSPQFNSYGKLKKVNFAISDQRYKLQDNELLSGLGLNKELPWDQHDVPGILRLLEKMYDIRSVDVNL